MIFFTIFTSVIFICKWDDVHGKKLPFTPKEVGQWASNLGEELYKLAMFSTGAEEVVQRYRDENARVEKYDPEDVLDVMAERLSNYMDRRRTLAQKLKSSLEVGSSVYKPPSKDLLNSLDCYNGTVTDRLQCIEKVVRFDYRFVDARPDDVYKDPEFMSADNATPTNFLIRGLPNPNFYNLSVDTNKSAVHVPTPIYKYNPLLLEEIHWSGFYLDFIFKDNRQNDFPGASWQFYCSKNGFMRFYPAFSWNLEMVGNRNPIDLFDCRNAEWYIDAATNTKNVIILLDMSGSMFGQRYEIAKQTIESILETLSENDFFNIIMYNQKPEFLIPCFTGLLVQATLRNKQSVNFLAQSLTTPLSQEHRNFHLFQLMRDQLSSREPENVADLEEALKVAFETLIGLNISSNWTAAPETTLNPHDEELEPEERAAELERRYLEYVERMMENRTTTLGCNSAIMLITDGAIDYYKDIFQSYNKDKKIRFFSFLIGNDVTQRREVEWMACNYRGYFVHISNLADVQEKVQKYLQVMSRPIAKRGQNQTKAIWTGAYLDKMGHRLVTTVAYPVVVKGNFTGVVGASAPITELQQMAAVYMLGANAYSFLVDNNGYVMFHPQLRSWYRQKAKPNYNSMDIMEMEVLQSKTIPNFIRENYDVDNPMEDDLCDIHCYYKALIDYQAYDPKTKGQSPPGFKAVNLPIYAEANYSKLYAIYPIEYDHQLRKAVVNGSNSRHTSPKISLQVLYAMEGNEGLRRIYEQTNYYYYRGINETLMTLGLAVPPDAVYRITWSSDRFPLKSIDLRWFHGTHWRLHPDWHYCRFNDSNSKISKEQVFNFYLKTMKNREFLPDKCANYSYLISRLLYDAKATCKQGACWVSETRLHDSRKGVHLIFLVTHSGLSRTIIKRFDDISHTAPPIEDTVNINGTITNYYSASDEKPYVPFLRRHSRGLDENFYKRAMRFSDGEFIFDVDPQNALYISNDSANFRHIQHRKSFIVMASRSLFLKESHEKMAPIGVIGLEMLYVSLAEMVQNFTDNICKPETDFRCYLIDEHGYIVYTSAVSDPALLAKHYLGKFFGHAPYVPDSQQFDQLAIPYDKAEALSFNKMVDKGFYDNFTYIDFQAMCSSSEFGGEVKVGASSRLLSPFSLLFRLLSWVIQELALFFIHIVLWNWNVKSSAGYTLLFRDLHEGGGPCDKWSPFYFLTKSKTKPELLFNSEIECVDSFNNKHGPCSILSYAARVPKTNLVLVLIKTPIKDCANPACVHTQRSKMPLFGLSIIHNATDKLTAQTKCDKRKYEARYRRSPSVCFPMEEAEEDEGGCSGSEATFRFRKMAIYFLCSILCCVFFFAQ